VGSTLAPLNPRCTRFSNQKALNIQRIPRTAAEKYISGSTRTFSANTATEHYLIGPYNDWAVLVIATSLSPSNVTFAGPLSLPL